MYQAIAPQVLDFDTLRQTLEQALSGQFTRQKVLVLIPDHTRTMPLAQLFPLLVELLRDTRQLDFMVALGTHPPLDEAALCRLVGITPQAYRTTFRHVRLLNHDWQNPQTLARIGVLSQDFLQTLAGEAWHPSLGGDVAVEINRHIFDYDHLIILGPTFPHEVVGFSGGAKYLFPGISGAAMINFTHWLGALMTIMNIIGIKETAVREVIHAAARYITRPITLISLVVVGEGVAGVFIGDYLEAWKAAADLSAQRHIVWVEKPYQRVLSCIPPMYDELWTGAKGMYKLEPAIADGGEVIVFAPHLMTVSHVHGRFIDEIGYHVRDYFLHQWERFKHVPLGVLAHSTHLRGAGRFANGREEARIRVSLASQISREHCERLCLGYYDPQGIHAEEWQGREDEGILLVPKAGEVLYRLKPSHA